MYTQDNMPIEKNIQLAVVEIQQNSYRQALIHLNKALELNIDNTDALLLSAQCLHALGEVKKSENYFMKLLEVDPENAFYHHSLAILYNDFSQPAKAIIHAEKAVALAANQYECWIQLSTAYRSNKRMEDAIKSAETAVQLSNAHPDSLRTRAYALLEQNNPGNASIDFHQRMLKQFSSNNLNLTHRDFSNTSKAKLLHDIEQFEYLKLVKGDNKYDLIKSQYENVLSQLDSNLPSETIITLSPSVLNSMQNNYNRLHHFEQAEKVSGSSLNTSRNFKDIEIDYENRTPGITWIDDFLSESSLNALRKYCLENTFWFDFHHPNGYLGALMENGFAAPLLFQIAEELRLYLPAIFKDYPLIQMWAFKYDSQLQGIQMHADIAAVNLNFWITPDEANLNPNSGGLVVWDKEAPNEWGFNEYNTGEVDRQKRIQDFLKESGANKYTVPYKQNRAVLFNSDLFHSTDFIEFKPGYENRRINITLLFGHRN